MTDETDARIRALLQQAVAEARPYVAGDRLLMHWRVERRLRELILAFADRVAAEAVAREREVHADTGSERT